MALPTMRAKLFDEREIEQIQWLAKQYKSRPHRQTIPNQDFSAIVKDNDEFSRLIERMQSLGVIDSLNSGGVILNDGILDVERNLAIAVKEATKPPDRIDQFYRWCRRHWATAIIIAIFLVGSFLIVLANQIWELYLKIHPQR